jgi:hypothetical protein
LLTDSSGSNVALKQPRQQQIQLPPRCRVSSKQKTLGNLEQTPLRLKVKFGDFCTNFILQTFRGKNMSGGGFVFATVSD